METGPREPGGESPRSRRGAQDALERAGAHEGSGAVRNVAYLCPVASNDFGLLTVTALGIGLPIALALLLPHQHLDSAVVLSIPCGLVAATASAALAARDRRRSGKPVNGGVLVAYAALVVLGAGVLVLTVAAIAFYRTPLTF
jgi:hypothetical protein